MTPYYQDESVRLFAGDCLDVLRDLPDSSVDAVVTDPPYGLAFMGRAWDDHVDGRKFGAWCEQWATECLRVLKPGGHLLAFGGTRTYHRLGCAIEDAGFEMRDSITWLYGSGFPKSLDVSKAIDKRRDWKSLPLLQAKVRQARHALGISQSEAARRVGLIEAGESLGGGGFMWFETGMRVPTREQYPRLKAALELDDTCDRAFEEAEREVTGTHVEWENRVNYALTSKDGLRRDKPATAEAEQWSGWGTALKPASEPIVVARKPLSGTVASNVLRYGTGALNVDGCRVPGSVPGGGNGEGRSGGIMGRTVADARPISLGHNNGRWPTNVVLSHGLTEDGTDACANGCPPGCAVRELDAQSGTLTSGVMRAGTPRSVRQGDAYGEFGEVTGAATHGDSGGASRFFPTFRYEAKAPTVERPRDGAVAHPTVKPLDLMRWLIRLVTPPGGTVLEPFAGSGTTAEAAVIEGFQCIAIEREPSYLPLIVARLSKPIQPDLFGGAA